MGVSYGNAFSYALAGKGGNMDLGFRYDEVGYWSELKLEIIKKYARAYSKILSTRTSPTFYHMYIDAFSGAGTHISKSTGDAIPGSPTIALQVEPKFKEYHFIDLNPKKIEALRNAVGAQPNVFTYHGDCNKVLIEEILPMFEKNKYYRALCLLDPYGLHLDWEVIERVGRTKAIDLFLNFPVADMNRNVLWRRREGVSEEQIRRMNRFWGDGSWEESAYITMPGLFGDMEEKNSIEAVVNGFRKRLNDVALFKNVPTPLAMKNGHNATVYYLFFAAHVDVATKIVRDIFKKYSGK